jgi:hypothetical protein
MTGKDEWRAVHIQNGVLIDSVTTKQPGQGQQKDGWTGSTYMGAELSSVGGTPAGSQTSGVNLANRKRDSDNNMNAGRGPTLDVNGFVAGSPGTAGTLPSGVAIGANGQPIVGQPGMGQPGIGQPAPQPGQVYPGAIVPNQPGIPGMPPGTVVGGINGGRGPVPGMPGTPGATGTGVTPNNNNSGGSYMGGGGSYMGGNSYMGGGSTVPVPIQGANGQVNPNQPGFNQPGFNQPGANQPGFNQPGFPSGNPVNSQVGGVSPVAGSPYPTTAGANGNPPGFNQPGINMSSQAQSAAAAMIGNILTQPRPGGMPTANTAGVQTMGGGIAGFASTADEDSIMVYNDRTNYHEWEFVFDPAKVKPLFNPNSGAIGTPASQLGTQAGTPATQVGTPAGALGTPVFGTPGTTGTPGAFGTPATATPGRQ